ncbi:MAG: capsid jelly roll protein [Cressdnaviricota sp.]|nr:MAG: capsid jelly roll protein [Cressdnaviricota sp.]
MPRYKRKRSTGVRRSRTRTIRRLRKRVARSIARPLRPATYRFKRSISTTLDLGNIDPDPNWIYTPAEPGANRKWVFALSDLTEFGDFTSLFGFYRINAVNVQIIMPNTVTDAGALGQAAKGNFIAYAISDESTFGNQYSNGIEAAYLRCQSHSKKLLTTTTGRGHNFYMKVKQLSLAAHSAENNDYRVMRPAFISTAEPYTKHYGMQTRIQRTDNQPFVNGTMKVILTYYIECKRVE